MRESVIAVMCAVCAVALIGCAQRANNPENVTWKTAAHQPVGIVDYGSGVLYFAHEGADFGNALAAYRGKYPDKEIAAVAGNGNGGYGRDIGY